MRHRRFIITYEVPDGADDFKPWELCLGRPRPGGVALGLLVCTIVALAATHVIGRIGFYVPSWWVTTLQVASFVTVIALAVATSAYSLVATAVLLGPVVYLAFVDVLVDIGVLFWCFAAVTTVLGGVLTIRAGRIWKLYRSQRS